MGTKDEENRNVRSYKWRYPLIAFLTILAVALLVELLVSTFMKRLDLSFDWVTLGLGMMVFFIVRDLLLIRTSDEESREALFTNWRDTFVIVLGLLVASAVIVIPELSSQKSVFMSLASYLVALSLAFTVFYFGGSSKLKDQLIFWE